jgi:stage V sporulation protein R
MEFILEYSSFLNKDRNRWMKSVAQVVRQTSVFFQPQIRTKILNEGWASYWHENLFLKDDRIKGHEVEFARVNAYVTSLPRVGLNPYALGLRLFRHVEESADKGRFSLAFQRLQDAHERKVFDAGVGEGRDYVFRIREDYSDYLFISRFVDQDFVDKHKLFVAGRRLSQNRMNWEYYIKSRKAEDYRQMILNILYHPPSVLVDRERSNNGELHLVHRFEGKPLKTDYIPNTLIGVEYLWGGPVHLETSEPAEVSRPEELPYSPTRVMVPPEEEKPPDITWQRVRYTMKNRELSKTVL